MILDFQIMAPKKQWHWSCGFCKEPKEAQQLKRCVCQKISYCSKECQAKDWKSHRPSCPLVVVRESPGKGRGLFATRKIKEGGIIIDEKPLVSVKTPWSDADLLAHAKAAFDAVEAGQLDVTNYPVGQKMNYHELKTNFVPSLSENTKAKILEIHDPAENLQGLDTKTVKRLRRKNPHSWLTEDAKGDEDEAKIWRILACYLTKICGEKILYGGKSLQDVKDGDYNLLNPENVGDPCAVIGELVNPKDDGSALYYTICQINHACVPNAVESYVMEKIERHQVRALRPIEKDEEILLAYFDKTETCYGSRNDRRERLQEKFGFLCECSECSLEGEALDINEGIRVEIRQITEERSRLMRPQGSSSGPSRKNMKKSMKLSQQKVNLLQKLDLRALFVTAMINFYAQSKMGRDNYDIPSKNDPEVFKMEALKYAKMYGDCFIHIFHRYTQF